MFSLVFFAVLLLLAAVAGAGGSWWLYGRRMGDAGISECRDPELQGGVLRRRKPPPVKKIRR